MKHDWTAMCDKIPFALGTDCKSLYDVCTKQGSMPDERRVALDLLDVRESTEQMGDQIRWIPTDHMLVDCMTKFMPADAMLEYLKHNKYAFKYDDVIKNTKRAVAKARKEAREKKALDKLPREEDCDACLAQGINVIQHYELYRPMFEFLYPQESVRLNCYAGDYVALVKEKGFEEAYVHVVQVLTR